MVKIVEKGWARETIGERGVEIAWGGTQGILRITNRDREAHNISTEAGMKLCFFKLWILMSVLFSQY